MALTMGDFRALPILFTNDTTNHYIYIKKHSVRENSISRPSNRTLFAVNIPPFLNEIVLNDMFKITGEIELLQLSDKPTSSEIEISHKVGFKVAYVVYKNESSLNKALKLNQLKCPYDELKKYNGILKWIRQYNSSITDVQQLKDSVNRCIEKYDRETKDKAEKDKMLGEADDEGWVTVTKQGRKTGFTRSENVTEKIRENINKKRDKKELKNFYTFQIRESKMNHVIALRQKFEEDKKKVIALKQTRRFKPF